MPNIGISPEPNYRSHQGLDKPYKVYQAPDYSIYSLQYLKIDSIKPASIKIFTTSIVLLHVFLGVRYRFIFQLPKYYKRS